MEEKKGRNLNLEINNSEENLIEGKNPKLEIIKNNNKKERKIQNDDEINNFYNLSEKRPNSSIFRGKKNKYKIQSKLNGNNKYLENKNTLESEDTTSKEISLKKEKKRILFFFYNPQ